ncbi:MAG: VWA domain-containing protein, partial [Melioribacteraceae bacterium]|nr:VWA domain-containing protein [Melioribacteraceae bacterium]
MLNTITLFLSLLLFLQLSAQSKKDFDLSLPDNEIGKTTVYRDGKMFKGTKLEYSLMEGGYFTMGTSNGISESNLDNQLQLTFGHPYALTSFIEISINGGAYLNFDDLFPAAAISKSNDTLAVAGASENLSALIYLNQKNDSTISITGSIFNTGAETIEASMKLNIDPAIGKWGDGFLFYNDEFFAQQNVITGISSSDQIEIYERSGQPFGAGISLSFPGNLPESFAVMNWNYSDETITELFDLYVEIESPTVNIEPESSYEFAVEVKLLEPEFTNPVFVRWDFPQFLTVDNGLLFPRNINSMIRAYNSIESNIQIESLSFSANELIDTTTSFKDTIINVNSSTYMGMNIFVPENYEDKTLSVTLEALNADGIALDAVTRRIFIPAVPLSDSGLVVNVDSIMTSGFPDIDIRFNVKNEETGGYVFGLRKENIFLYEEGTRLYDYTIMKDTSGGSNEVDIVFVLDVTGSMSDEIVAVKNNIIEFADSLILRGVDYRLGMVTFLDIIENVYDFTDDAVLFKSYVAEQFAHGGGDYPENSLEALNTATQFDFRPSSNRMVIWITDASYHEGDGVTSLTVEDVLPNLLTAGMTVNCIGNSYEQTDFYDPIVIPTGGTFYDIYGNFRDILLDITRGQSTFNYLLSYTSTQAAGSQINGTIEVHYAGLGAIENFVIPGTLSPQKYAPVLQCYPNPFNPYVNIQVEKSIQSMGAVRIFNVLGEVVYSANIPAGEPLFRLTWNGITDSGFKVSSGVYIVRAVLEN